MASDAYATPWTWPVNTRPESASRMFIGPVGRRELLWRGPGLQASQAALNSALAVSRSLAEPIGQSAGQMDGDVPQPDAAACVRRRGESGRCAACLRARDSRECRSTGASA